MPKLGELDPKNTKADINMTPMIDCVFLMLLFFMMTSEMSSLDMEAMSLPYASQAQSPEKVIEDDQVVINIKKDDAKKGIVRVQAGEYDKNKLSDMIRNSAIGSGIEPQTDPELAKLTVYRLRVLIRCDRDARYETVQWVFDACTKNGVYKTVIAATKTTE